MADFLPVKKHMSIKTRIIKTLRGNVSCPVISSICWERVFEQTDDINILVNDYSTLCSLVIKEDAPLREMCALLMD